MPIEEFIVIVTAVLVANVLSGVVLYGVWRATKIERKFGITNAGGFLPLPLLLAMCLPFGIGMWGALLLY